MPDAAGSGGCWRARPPARYSSPADPDGDFDGATVEPGAVREAFDVWRVEAAFSGRFTADAPDLDVTGYDEWRGEVSLRWVLIHLVQESARHNGRADLPRERIDGARRL